MPSPLIWDPAVASQTARAIEAADDAIGSGVIQSGMIGNAAVTSGNVASGAIGRMHLASGAVNSGHIANAAVVSGSIASGQIGQFHLSSGTVVSGHVGNAAVVSGSVASGQIGWPHLASGAVRSGHIGDGAVVSGSIASGQISTNHLASGFSVVDAQRLIENSWITLERISGGKAVCFSQSGTLQIAMAGVSGRMPAVGVLETNVESGIAATFTHQGRLLCSGQWNFSGFISRQVFVDTSGDIVRTPPSASGNVQQRLGVVTSHSGIFVQMEIEGVQV